MDFWLKCRFDCASSCQNRKLNDLSPLDAKMEIITTQDIRLGNEILLLCKGEVFKFEIMDDKVWVQVLTMPFCPSWWGWRYYLAERWRGD